MTQRVTSLDDKHSTDQVIRRATAFASCIIHLLGGQHDSVKTAVAVELPR